MKSKFTTYLMTLFISISINGCTPPEPTDSTKSNNQSTIKSEIPNSNTTGNILKKFLEPIFMKKIDSYIDDIGLKQRLSELRADIAIAEPFKSEIAHQSTKDGKIAFCGDTVVFKINEIGKDEKNPEQNKSTLSLTERLGYSTQAANTGIIGMQEGEEKLFYIDKLYLNPKNFIPSSDPWTTYYITLQEVLGSLAPQDAYLKDSLLTFDLARSPLLEKNELFNANTTEKTDTKNTHGYADKIVCGDYVEVKYRQIFPTNISQSTTLEFNIGSNISPFALEQGVIGMNIGTSRLIIYKNTLWQNSKEIGYSGVLVEKINKTKEHDQERIIQK